MVSLALLLLLMITMVTPSASMAVANSVNLKTAESFALLADSTITIAGTTASTVIDGDVGLHPGDEFTGQENAIVNGTVHLADAVALQAKNDMKAAYDEAVLRPTNTIGAELGGKIMSPGVYGSATELGLTGTLTLDGQNNPDAIFIFKAGSSLTTISGSKIKLINGANFKNIFWLVGSSATLGTNSEFSGNILAMESITVTTGADVHGKLFAFNGAVTLDNNQITNVTTSALTVIKVVEGDTTGITMPLFNITVTGPEGFEETEDFVPGVPFTWTDLIPGKYTITENRVDLNNKWAVVSPVDVQLMANQPEEVEITNTYNSLGFSSLKVSKYVNGDTSGITMPAFSITLTGPLGYTNPVSIVENGSYTFNNLLPGTYTVTENRTGLNSRWAVVSPVDVQVVADQAHTATITNTYTPRVDSTPVDITPVDSSPVVSAYGTLTVGKIVGGDPAGMSLQTFEIMVTGPGNFSETKSFVHNEVFTWSNLVPGDYEVTENRNSLGDGWTVSGEGVVTVNANQAHSATITNVYTTPVVTIPDDTTPVDVPVVEVTNGTLTVRKIVTGDTSGMTLPAFEITVTGPEGFTTTKTFVHNESFTWVNLVPGEYTITENKTGLNSRWAVSGEGAAQVVANQTTMTTITNNYRNVVGIPQTSQNTDYGTAMALGMIALMLAGAGVLSAKTRKKYRA